MVNQVNTVYKEDAKAAASTIASRVDFLVWQLYKGRQYLFADAAGISRATLSKMLKSGTAPSAETLIQILGSHRFVDPYWLLLGEGEMLTPDAPTVPLV